MTQGTRPRAAASAWLESELTRHAPPELGGAASSFGLLAAWADASSLSLQGDAARRRQRRAKRVVEIDRLAALLDAGGEGGGSPSCGGGILTISGAAMRATSCLTDVLVGPRGLLHLTDALEPPIVERRGCESCEEDIAMPLLENGLEQVAVS